MGLDGGGWVIIAKKEGEEEEEEKEKSRRSILNCYSGDVRVENASAGE